ELSEKLRIIEKTNVSVSITTLLDYSFNDKSYAQLCADYGICFATARVRIHVGRKKLKKELAGFLK
ncbi:hypothetical protein HY484_01710, partial [Candidatus Woesearchaeota archaeon]|nr:hypothetical protein [Candidatus Woesearchaeota archaeon]